MTFLPPNQQHQNTEGKWGKEHIAEKICFKFSLSTVNNEVIQHITRFYSDRFITFTTCLYYLNHKTTISATTVTVTSNVRPQAMSILT